MCFESVQVAGTLSKSTEVMKLVNDMMKVGAAVAWLTAETCNASAPSVMLVISIHTGRLCGSLRQCLAAHETPLHCRRAG